MKRDESNQNYESTTIFSSKRLEEVLAIPGYKIILPASWERHNVARVVVYVQDELKVETKPPQEGADHIQSKTIELGFGRAKKHCFNFYYRGNKEDKAEDLSLLLN